jgi:hypothetical protein
MSPPGRHAPHSARERQFANREAQLKIQQTASTVRSMVDY